MDEKQNKPQEAAAELDEKELDEVAGGIPMFAIAPDDEPCTGGNDGRQNK